MMWMEEMYGDFQQLGPGVPCGAPMTRMTVDLYGPPVYVINEPQRQVDTRGAPNSPT